MCAPHITHLFTVQYFRLYTVHCTLLKCVQVERALRLLTDAFAVLADEKAGYLVFLILMFYLFLNTNFTNVHNLVTVSHTKRPITKRPITKHPITKRPIT